MCWNRLWNGHKVRLHVDNSGIGSHLPCFFFIRPLDPALNDYFVSRFFRTTQPKSSRPDQVRINNKLLQGLTEGLAGAVAGLGRTNQAWAGLAANTRLARAELREMTEALESRKRPADVRVVFSSAAKLQDSRDSSNEGTNNTKIMLCPKIFIVSTNVNGFYSNFIHT